MLPREIRDVIYTYVLHLDRFKIQQSISHRGNLDASILYLNKQIHAQALEAVRNQACWMLLIMDYETYEHIRHHVRRTFATPGTDRLGSLMIDSQEAIDFMKTFAITLTIGLDLADPLLNCGGRPPQVQGGDVRVTALIPTYAISKIWRWLPFHNVGPHIHPPRTINAVLDHSHCRSDPRDLVSFLTDVKGLSRVDIEGVKDDALREEMVSMMTKVMRNDDDVIDVLSAYQDLALQQLEQGDKLSARSTYFDGWGCFSWWLYVKFTREPHTGRFWQSFDYRRDMAFGCARLTLELGPQAEVHPMMTRLFSSEWSSDEDWGSHIGQAHFLIGASYVALGEHNAAVYYLLEALYLEPGYTEADEEFDRLESKLLSSTNDNDTLAQKNMEDAAKGYRHLRSRNGPLNNEEYELRKLAGDKQPFRHFRDCVDALHRVRY